MDVVKYLISLDIFSIFFLLFISSFCLSVRLFVCLKALSFLFSLLLTLHFSVYMLVCHHPFPGVLFAIFFLAPSIHILISIYLGLFILPFKVNQLARYVSLPFSLMLSLSVTLVSNEEKISLLYKLLYIWSMHCLCHRLP